MMSNKLLKAELAKLNEQQRQAVEAKERKVLVAASAGTGKTTVLASRVLNNLNLKQRGDSKKINVKDFLILTFTEEAAKNMKDRIRTKLQGLLSQELTDKEKEEINKQINQLDDADISTIDAFCNKVVQTYFYKLGIDPEYDILAADSAKEKFRQQALDEVLEAAYQKAQEDENLRALLTFLTKDSKDDSLRTVLISLFDFLGSIDNPKNWLETQKDNTKYVKYNYIKQLFEKNQELVAEVLKYENENDPVVILANDNLRTSFREVKAIYTMLQTADNIEDFNKKYDAEYHGNDERKTPNKSSAKTIRLKETHDKYIEDKKANKLDREFLERYIDEVEAYQEAAKHVKEVKTSKVKVLTFKVKNENGQYENRQYLDEAKELLEGKEIKTVKKGTKKITPYQLDELFPKKYKKIETFVNILKEIVKLDKMFNPNLETFREYKTNIINLYKAFEEKYQAIKEARNLYEYADIERLTSELMKDSDVKAELQTKYHQIIVDEYQDTNRLQDTIITEIAGDQNTLFLVGDVKQAIYGFRNADHTVFVDKQESFSQEDDAAVLTLEENYRTRKEITDQINNLFEHIMPKEDEVSYQGQEIQASNPMFEGIENDENIISPFEFNVVEYEANEDKTEVQVNQVINSIQAMLNNPQIVIRDSKDKTRTIEPKDIAIISRSWSGSSIYTKMLKDAGIPYRISRSEAFLEKFEIQVALAYLKMLVDPFDNISTVTVLHSPIYNFDEKELAFMKVVGKGKKFATKYWSLLSEENITVTMQKAADYQVNFEVFQAKLTKFQEDYNYLSQLADVLSASALLNKIFENTDIIESFTAMPQGSDRRANLYGLISYLEELESTLSPGIQEVIAAFENGKKVQEINQNADDNAVTYTTIHGSKGLEWPVVFVVNNENKYNLNNDKVLYARDPQLGIGINVDGVFQKNVKDAINQREANEAKRFMYVALTRAKQALRVYGALKKDAKPSNEIKSNLDLLKSAAAKSELAVNVIASSATTSANKVKEVIIPKPIVNEVDENQEYQFNAASEIKTSSPTTAVKKSFNPFDKGNEIKLIQGNSVVDVTQDTNLLNDAEIEVSADEFGTAVHLIFEKLDLTKVPTTHTVNALVEALKKEGIISQNVVEALNKPVSNNTKQTHLDGIVAFYQTEIGQEVVNAAKNNKLEREKNITMMVNATSVANDEDAIFDDDFTIIHGIIDCLYQREDGSYVIVDYKTDKRLNQEKVFKENYPGQLAMYAKTLEMMGKKVTGCYLYGVRHHLVFDVMEKK